ncbi:Integral membrane protein, partial [human gut metagenome]
CALPILSTSRHTPFVDIDAFSVAHRDQWERLDHLVAAPRLSGAQVDELVTLYRSAARDLSRLRTGAPDP